jgi:plastocyanin
VPCQNVWGTTAIGHFWFNVSTVHLEVPTSVVFPQIDLGPHTVTAYTGEKMAVNLLTAMSGQPHSPVVLPKGKQASSSVE